LIRDRVRFVTRIAKYRGVFCRQILIHFELQALVSRGRSTVPSRASSAA
jgi:hypothetical protein